MPEGFWYSVRPDIAGCVRSLGKVPILRAAALVHRILASDNPAVLTGRGYPAPVLSPSAEPVRHPIENVDNTHSRPTAHPSPAHPAAQLPLRAVPPRTT